MKDCRIYKVYSIVLYVTLLSIVGISFIGHKRLFESKKELGINDTVYSVNIMDNRLLDEVNNIQNSLDSLRTDLQELKDKKDSVVVKLDLMQY